MRTLALFLGLAAGLHETFRVYSLYCMQHACQQPIPFQQDALGAATCSWEACVQPPWGQPHASHMPSRIDMFRFGLWCRIQGGLQSTWPDACRTNAQARTSTVRTACTRLRGMSARVPSRCCRRTPRTATTTSRSDACFGRCVVTASAPSFTHARGARMLYKCNVYAWVNGVGEDQWFI